MGDKSGIEWTDATWNPIVGCSIVSPGCTNCYAMEQAARIQRMTKGNTHYKGTTRTVNGHDVWTGKVQQAPVHIWTAPLTWKKPRRIFVNSMGDLFHESVPDAWIDRAFAVMALSPQHTFQVLTKRSARMRNYMGDRFRPNLLARRLIDDYLLTGKIDRNRAELWPVQSIGDTDAPDDVTMKCWPLPNVWLGVSAEDQPRADERIPDLLATPAAVRFVSAEPLLGPVDFTTLCTGWNFVDALRGVKYHDAPEGVDSATEACAKLDWIIVGGESGPNARPMHPDWARSIRDQCAATGTAFFFKQWGEWTFDERVGRKEMRGDDQPHAIDERWSMICVGKKRAGRHLDGIEHNAMPEVK